MILRVYQKSLPYEVRFLRCGLRQTYFFVILGHFLPFHPVFCPYAPLWTQKIKILKLWKKTPGAITILQRCTMNDNHMMYGSWDMERDGHFGLFHFGPFFFLPIPPPPPPTTKIKILKNEKTPGDIMLHKCTKNHDHMLLFLRYDAWRM